MARILLIDDDANLGEVLAFALSDQGHDVQTRLSGEDGLAATESFHPDLVITDLRMPGGIGGMEVLRRAIEADPSRPVILLTAYGTIEDAVEAMKLGAFDYLTKPVNREELRLRVNAALDRRRLLRENQVLRTRLRTEARTLDIVHASAAMSEVLARISRVAATEATVLLIGESGTGKELLARALHSGSDRSEGPFVAVNCAAIPRDLLESELFGHARGAFTGAVRERAGKFRQAERGTLFLDEVAELAPDLQSKLLRVIETREVDVVGGTAPVPVDVRIVAATNADLDARVASGDFRRDLFYRLNVIPVTIPPLRERPDDIPALWEHFVRRHAGGAPVRSAPELMRALMLRAWPGNVRELANLAQRMVLLRTSDTLTLDDLAAVDGGGRKPGTQAETETERARATSGDPRSMSGFLGKLPDGALPLFEVEREIIRRALEKHGGNRTRAAAYLGIPRHVLLYRLEKFGLE